MFIPHIFNDNHKLIFYQILFILKSKKNIYSLFLMSDHLALLAKSYVHESNPSASNDLQKNALQVLNSFIDNKINYSEAQTCLTTILGTAAALEKINNILNVPETPLPPSNDGTQNKDGEGHESSNSEEHSDNDSGDFNGRSSSHNKSRSKTGKRKLHPWSQTEDNRLLAGIVKYGVENWHHIAQFVENSRSKAQCSQRWFRGLDPSIRKCRWTYDEEIQLNKLVEKFGLKSWTKIAAKMKNRSDVQCRYHYNQMVKSQKVYYYSHSIPHNSDNYNQSSPETKIDNIKIEAIFPPTPMNTVSQPKPLSTPEISMPQIQLEAHDAKQPFETKPKLVQNPYEDFWDIQYQNWYDDWSFDISTSSSPLSENLYSLY
ncbi:Myb-like DNA-binding domain containing protein [Tritrichomonas foetus]|uniref:Myb-like DNA-binding domain containing protein n=1 Tax=Tritrichomonas foetus TaxID=1144522 RepID=A0A1J4KQF3_9EUKA|nr:Myb-like DNA-binding domain containing protein [Tritrichomonas foetus]|eukprot:OHT11918.1 Myb-like DNA-binding domain containing protein [Tritrichomonas foetus]